MRIILSILISTLIAVALGCGDDDDAAVDAGDARADAARGDAAPGDAAPPPSDAGDHADGHVPPSAKPDAGDAGDAGGTMTCDLEPSYIWDGFDCDGSRPDRIARRMTLDAFCKRYGCPRDWTAALAVSAECADADAGTEPCWSVGTWCGSAVLEGSIGPNASFLYYDHATGKLIGGAVQLSDAESDCVESEIIAGENDPKCTCDDLADAG